MSAIHGEFLLFWAPLAEEPTAPQAPNPTDQLYRAGREEAKRPLTGARLLTLTGIGGASKARLALQIAANLLDDYPDGMWLMELAGHGAPPLVPQAVL